MKEIRSAGIIVYVHCDEEILFLLLRHTQGGHWGFPKGRMEPGETVQQAALRELYEEAGIVVDIADGFCESIYYMVGREAEQVPKRVDCFIGHCIDKYSVVLSHEHEEYRWLPLILAQQLVARKSVQQVLEKAHIFIRKIQ